MGCCKIKGEASRGNRTHPFGEGHLAGDGQVESHTLINQIADPTTQGNINEKNDYIDDEKQLSARGRPGNRLEFIQSTARVDGAVET